MPYAAIDLSRVKTYSLSQRPSLVALANLISPDAPPPPYENPELAEVAERIVASRQGGAR